MIDANALRKKCVDLVRCIDAEAVKEDYYDGMEVGVENVLKFIDEQPTIDAEPIRHGKWIEYPAADGMNQCSVCGVLRFGDSNYCPNCGARMDKQETNDAAGKV